MSTAALLIIGALATVATGLVVALARTARRLRASRAEAAQLRSMVKDRLERPNVFSHEVRTPLSLIGAAAELLEDESPGPLTEQQREFVTTIAANAHRIRGLADDMLVEAKIDSTLFELSLSRFDLRALVRRTVREVRRIHRTTIRLENQGAPLLVTADADLLRQALWNLVNNAASHAGDGVTITVEVTAGEGHAVVAVSDDGIGMSEQEQDTLFTPYATSHRGGSGTGLGMMITERIVRQHGGRLLVDSLSEHGTTIFFTIPDQNVGGERG